LNDRPIANEPDVEEAKRLAALERYRILDTPHEAGFDDIVRIAALVCDTPVALIGFIDDRRQWFKAGVGLAATELPRGVAFCARAIQQEGILVVGDTMTDERFAKTPLVTGEPRLRFYAGAPIGTPDGFRLGTLCVLDERPRELTKEQLDALAALSRQVMAQLEIRRHLADTKAEEKRHRLILESAVDYGIISMHIDGTVTSWNEGAHRIFGWSEEEMCGRRCDDFFTPEDRAAGIPEREMGAALTRGRGNDERWHLRKDGSRFWGRGEMMPLTGDDGKAVGFLKIVQDRTEQRQAELALQELNATLEQRVAEEIGARSKIEETLRQSQKMEAIGQLTGGIAHDFNNLLTGILGALDLVRRRLSSGRTDDIPRLMEAASASATKAAALIHRLLAFARRQSLDIKPNDVNLLVASMEDLLHRTLGEHIQLKTILPSDLWPVSTDANQLENALLNLAINARDAMPDGGSLTIRTQNIRLGEKFAHVTGGVDAGDYVLISVSDTGVGMPPDVLAKAVEPFFTTKPHGQGTGLGLSMIYGFVKQSGGYLRMHSQVGEGSSVKLYLPRAESAVPAAEARHGSSPSGDGETVLVVEDDETVRLLVVEVLAELGYHHLQAPDAQAAIPMLQSDSRIDLLITDVGLPGGMNGRQLAEIGREARPELKVLLVTGYAESAASRSGFLDTGMDMLIKPFALDQLGTKVREMIEWSPAD
jgi:PAS domain S-box-containing protein